MTSLGLGAQQAASGIQHVFGIEAGLGLQVVVITVVTLLAVVSVLRGIDGGVKVISNINMLVAFLLLILVALIGYAVSLGSIPTTFMAYIENIIPLSNPHGRRWSVDARLDGILLAWWISWSPFVGMFIARVSKGRTVREFITAVLIVPTTVTIIWCQYSAAWRLTKSWITWVFLGRDGLTDVSLAMFQMFDALPFGTLLSIIAVILVLVFFITSSDSRLSSCHRQHHRRW